MKQSDVERSKKYRLGPTYQARQARKRAERMKCKKLRQKLLLGSIFTSVSRPGGEQKSLPVPPAGMSLTNLLLLRWARCSSLNSSDLAALCAQDSYGITQSELSLASTLRS